MTLGILKRFRKYIFKKKLVRANQCLYVVGQEVLRE